MLTFFFCVVFNQLHTTLYNKQTRCEAILRTQPHSRVAKELHLAAQEGQELYQQEQFQKAAVTSVAAAAAVGVLAGVAGLLLSSARKR